MALRKSDLYSSLWKTADELRGSMDASQYKDYVLTLLFVKYVTDKSKGRSNSLIDVPEGGSFDDLVALKGKPDIGSRINIAIRLLAEANDLQGVINNADFDDPTKLGEGKQMQDRLSNLIGIFQDLDFSSSKAEGDDLLGDAYEYLMRHFASEAGKSKGQFYTPSEVSRVLAELLEIPRDAKPSTTVYDPTCGSGSLLIKVADSVDRGLSVYGQEMDNPTWALARMNMILHGHETHEIRQGNTYADPKFLVNNQLQTFDYIVANPPFSNKNWRTGLTEDYGRFDGFPELKTKNGDFAFLLHAIKSLKSSGKAAVILPHGVLFRGKSEGLIRREIIQRGLIKAIVGLPPNLFYGTGIPACIVLIDKSESKNRRGIFMIDASKGYEKDGAKNRLRARDIHQIITTFKSAIDVPGYARMVSLDEISNAANDFNLNIPRYVPSVNPKDIQDLGGHVLGGIPSRDVEALSKFWSALDGLQGQLLEETRPGYFKMIIPVEKIQSFVESDPKTFALSKKAHAKLNSWENSVRSTLAAIGSSTNPNTLIQELGDYLLEFFKDSQLVDAYAIYEGLMKIWSSNLHDDVIQIMNEGWHAPSQPRSAIENKEKKLTETPDLLTGTGASAKKWKMDLLPPSIVIKHFFPEELENLEELRSRLDALVEEKQDLIDSLTGEDDMPFSGDDDEKVNKALVVKLMRALDGDDSGEWIRDQLGNLKELFDQEANQKKLIKELEQHLYLIVLDRYRTLSLVEIQKLVIEDKWFYAMRDVINSEFELLIESFVLRIQTLAKRYAHSEASLALDLENARMRLSEVLAKFEIK